MAVVKEPQGSRVGIKLDNGQSATGAALTKTIQYSNVKPAATDQDLFDVASGLAGLQDKTLIAILRTDEAYLLNQ